MKSCILFKRRGKSLKPLLMILLLCLAGVTNAMAQSFTVGDFNYSINDDGTTVTLISHVDGQNATGTLTIPSSVIYNAFNYPVTAIGSYAFDGCTGLTGDLYVGNSVETIGHDAFFGCSGFTGNLHLGNNVTTVGDNAFYGCSGFSGELIIDHELASVGADAFYNCSSLTGSASVVLTGTIGGYAFCNCTGITSVTIGDAVTTIPLRAFYGCSNLATVTIGEGVTTVAGYSFWNCPSITTVNFNATDCTSMNTYVSSTSGNRRYSVFHIDNNNNSPTPIVTLNIGENVTRIPTAAFKNSPNMTGVYFAGSVAQWCGITFESNPLDEGHNLYINGALVAALTIPQGVTAIPDNAFSGGSCITSLNISNSVTSIGASAFYNCTGMVSATIPNSVTDIGTSTFYNCSSLNSVIIPNSVTTISSSTFYGCNSLVSVTISNSVTTIENSAFYGCSSLSSIIISNSLTSISSYAFYGCSSLASITIPNSVTTIDFNAFYGCSGLSSVTLGNSIESIGYGAFYNCSGLTAVYYSGTLAQWCGITFSSENSNPLYYGHNLYINGALVTNLTIPEGVTAIPNYAFCCGTCINTVNIPSSVTSFGEYAFYNCSGIAVHFSGTIAQWCGITFANFGSNPLKEGSLYIDGTLVTNLVIPYGVTVINPYAFCSCTGIIGTLTLPNSLNTIGDNAFQGCTGIIGTLTLPNSLNTIGSYAFQGCTGFTGSLTIPNSVTTIGSETFKDCSGFTGSLTLGTNLNSLMYSTFQGCTGFTIMNYNATDCYFNGYLNFVPFGGMTSLTALNIGSNVQSLAHIKFNGCGSVNSINVLAETPPTINSFATTFEGMSASIPVTVPCGTLSAYQNAAGWSTFANIIEIEDDCDPLTYSINDDGVSVTVTGHVAGTAAMGELVIPETKTIDGTIYAVTAIGSYAFYHCSGLTGDLIIPNSVISISNQAFNGCSGFTGDLIIPGSVTTIGNSAFYNCTGFTGDLTISNSVTTIGQYAFYNCSGFTSLTIGSSVTAIDDYAFYYCSGLTSIQTLAEMPPTLNTNTTFSNVDHSIPVTVPCGTLEAYQNASGWSTFTNIIEEDCDPLTYSINNDGVSVTVTGHVDGTAATGSITIPETKTIDGVTYTVTKIGARAFFNYTGLTGDLVIPNTVTTIGFLAFAMQNGGGFDGTLTLGNSVTSIADRAFYNCNNLTGELVLPNSLTTIGTSAFSGCTGLTGSLVIPESLTEIGMSAFQNCSGFTGNLTIPVTVTSLSSGAFSGCSGITSMTVEKTVPYVLGSNAFSGMDPNIPVTVPCGSGDMYRYAYGWSLFINIVEDCSNMYAVSATANPNEGGQVAFGTEGETLFADAFEEYTIGNPISPEAIAAGHDWWRLWDTIPGSGTDGVVDQFSGNKCGHFTYGNDQVLYLGDKESGAYGLEFDIFIPEGKNAYFSLLHTHVVGDHWSNVEAMQCHLNLQSYGFGEYNSIPGHGIVKAGNYYLSDIPTAYDGWMHIRFFIDTDADVARFFLTLPSEEETQLCEWPWSWGIQVNGETTLAGVDFWPPQNADSSEFYIDNIRLTQFVGGTPMGSLTQNGLHHFTSGSDCTLTATANEGYNFTNWTENGEVVSTETTYSFTVTEDAAFVANFALDDDDPLLYFINDDGVSVTVYGHRDGTAATGPITIPEAKTINGVTYPVTAIHVYAFYNCAGLTGDLVIPNSVMTIGASAFRNCSGFTGNLVIGNGVTSTGEQPFQDCGFTGTLTLGNSLEVIGTNAFLNCHFTGTLTLPNTLTTIESSAFSGCNFTGDLNLPSSLTTIEAMAFKDCSGFTGNLTLPNSVTELGGWAFCNCSGFTGSLTIGTELDTIAGHAFQNCTSLSAIKSLAMTPPVVGADAFKNVDHSIPVFVPCGTSSAYMDADGWSTFTNMIENCGSNIEGAVNGVFSVSDSTQVYFSQGNLQYIGSATTPYWKFADNQWDIIGSSQANTAQNSNRDLFCWGTSGYDHGANQYQPWSYGGSNSDYYAYGDVNSNLFDGDGSADWGYNAISNGGNTENAGWRTLTEEEWLYLFNTRSTTSGIRFARATVNGVGGIIFLPDNWNPDIYELNDTNNFDATLSSNTISADEWVETLEANGAVFFPIAGWISISNGRYFYSDPGAYWSSTVLNANTAWYYDVYHYTNNYGSHHLIEFTDHHDRGNKRSVRLAIDVNALPMTNYSINVTPNPAEGGTVTGAGIYGMGTNCILTATPNEGYSFISWTENGTVVSTSETYSFWVTGSRNLVANFFQGENLTVYDGQATDGYVPVYGFYADAYLKSETVYPAAELDALAGNSIISMRFFASQNNVSWGNANFQVFLKEVDGTSINEFSGLDGATVIYEGPLSINDGMMEIVFNTPYQYNGGNLLLGVYNTVKGSYVTSTWYGENVQGASVQGYSYSSLDAINPTQRNFIPKTMFTYANGSMSIFTITATANPSEGGTVTINGTSSGETFISDNFEEYTVGNKIAYENIVTGHDWWTTWNNLPGSSEDGVVASYNGNKCGHLTYGNDQILLLGDNGDGVYELAFDVLVPQGKNGYFNVMHHFAGFNSTWAFQCYLHMTNNGSSSTQAPGHGTVHAGGNGVADIPCVYDAWMHFRLHVDTYADTARYYYTAPGENEVLIYEWQWSLDTYGNNVVGSGLEAMNFYPPQNAANSEYYLDNISFTRSRGEAEPEAHRGAVRASGTFVSGTTCVLTATPNEGYTFNNWTKDGVEVSTNAIYSFTVTEDAAFVANFSESQSSITQTSDLAQGWNWWSTYIEQDGIDGLTMLEESLGANGHQIKSQTDFVTNFGSMWMGMLTSINNEETYMLDNYSACQVVLTGTAARPSDHPITVSSGWNWIGYPCTNTMSVAEAFSGYTPSNGDQVKSQSDYAMYYGGMWIGQLQNIVPGTGLMYKSNSPTTNTLVYPDGGRSAEMTISPRATHWTNDIHAYPNNMTVMAVVELDGQELSSDSYELAAFDANGECRGSVRLMYVEPIDRHVAFLTVSGKDAAVLSFRLYDTETGTEYYDANENLNFTTNAIVGDADDLYTIHFRGTTGMDELASSVKVYPNPVNRGEQFSIGMTDNGMKAVRVEIVNALGVETLRATSVQMPATLTAPATAGVYTLRITVEGKGTIVRKLVVK